MSEVIAKVQGVGESRASFTVIPKNKRKFYYGASEEGGVPNVESTIGATLGCFRSYFQAADITKLAAVVERDHRAGRLPIASIKLPATWREIANNSQRTWCMKLINALVPLKKEVNLCLHHEPENDSASGNGEDYIAMYFYFKGLIDSNPGAGHIKLTPILMSGRYNPVAYPDPDKRLYLNQWYRDGMAHEFGFDGYNHASPGVSNVKWRTVEQTFGPMFNDIKAASPNIPVLVCEYGVREDPEQPGRASDWMYEAEAFCRANQQVKAMAFFNSSKNVNDGGSSWWLTGERLTAFGALVKKSDHLEVN